MRDLHPLPYYPVRLLEATGTQNQKNLTLRTSYILKQTDARETDGRKSQLERVAGTHTGRNGADTAFGPGVEMPWAAMARNQEPGQENGRHQRPVKRSAMYSLSASGAGTSAAGRTGGKAFPGLP